MRVIDVAKFGKKYLNSKSKIKFTSQIFIGQNIYPQIVQKLKGVKMENIF